MTGETNTQHSSLAESYKLQIKTSKSVRNQIDIDMFSTISAPSPAIATLSFPIADLLVYIGCKLHKLPWTLPRVKW